MKGLGDLVDIRAEGLKPRAVWVELVKAHGPWGSLSRQGNLTIEILPTDSLAELDFRPLVGLDVTVSDHADSPKRLKRIAALVGAIETKTLVMRDGDRLHIRRGQETETHAL
jgi:hypothetical protein